jgi:hypothetical protein
VKAANTLGPDVLGSDPHDAGGQRVIFISGDDADAKAEVVALFQDAGSPHSISVPWPQPVRCSISTARSPASTSSDSEELPSMAVHTQLTPGRSRRPPCLARTL